jgi:hypothetical protein
MLAEDLVRAYEEKKVEFGTEDRVYCADPVCSAFIHVKGVGTEKATCMKCGKVTCVMCKAAAHVGDCPKDTAMQHLLATAKEEGWQRCRACRRVVELDTGCNHITYVLIPLISIQTETLLTSLAVAAAPNSATTVANHGRLATVPGTWSACWLAPSRSWPASSRREQIQPLSQTKSPW